MSQIVFAAGVSHSPVLTLDPVEWEFRAKADRNNPRLNTSDGRWLTYEQLEAEVGTVHADVARFEVYQRKSAGAQSALDRISAALIDSAPDVVVIVGDDQRELFTELNQPALAIYHGEFLEMTTATYGHPSAPDWLKVVARGYAMDQCHRFPGAPALALHVIQGLMDRGFDMGAVSRVADPTKAGLGHAYGFIIKRLFGDRSIPVLPILLNTYYDPNVPSAGRCYALGQALRAVLEARDSNERVALVASGGLSHFVVDEPLDQRVLSGLNAGQHECLVNIPHAALRSGSSEILNWITVAGAVQGHSPDWTDYYPVYRTPAGTGVGVAFAIWSLRE